MKFEELYDKLMEDYNYDFSGQAVMGNPQISTGISVNQFKPFDANGEGNKTLPRGLFPQKSNKLSRKNKKRLNRQLKNQSLKEIAKKISLTLGYIAGTDDLTGTELE